VSGFYAFVIFILVLIQPDFGSAIIIFLIWFGMVLISGISKKHLFGMIMIGVLLFAGAWNFGFKDYQKNDKLAENIVKALEKILTLTNNGGGSLYNKTKNFITQVKNIISSEKQKNSVTKQEPAPWLKNYMDKTKTPPAWLNQYMAENEAKEMENGMQSSLQEGNSVQNSLNHTSYFPNFEKD
jgi:energy-coupling factor transporter transmembrane protein EcfT